MSDINEIMHYGVKGMKWGVRNYQFADGSYTPAGKKRYQNNQNLGTSAHMVSLMNMKASKMVNTAKAQITGRQYVDTCLKQGTTFSRIQTTKDFENFAFYATYKKQDIDKYMGLFGNNLIKRAKYSAKQAEKIANASGAEPDIKVAKDARDYANNIKVYQLKLEAMKKLRVPSDENAGYITANLLKEKEFRNNVEASIADSKEKMRRPTQQLLFKQAQNAMSKDPSKMTSSEKVAVYKALNLSLTNHNPQEIAAQNRFYSELKKKGYNALLDYNDKEYSSYHAKRPMIMFDTGSVKLQSVIETNPKVVDKLYRKYNADRIAKEIPANTIGYINKFGSKKVSDCKSYINKKTDTYLDISGSSKTVKNYKKIHPNIKLTNKEIIEMYE